MRQAHLRLFLDATLELSAERRLNRPRPALSAIAAPLGTRSSKRGQPRVARAGDRTSRSPPIDRCVGDGWARRLLTSWRARAWQWRRRSQRASRAVRAERPSPSEADNATDERSGPGGRRPMRARRRPRTGSGERRARWTGSLAAATVPTPAATTTSPAARTREIRSRRSATAAPRRSAARSVEGPMKPGIGRHTRYEAGGIASGGGPAPPRRARSA